MVADCVEWASNKIRQLSPFNATLQQSSSNGSWGCFGELPNADKSDVRHGTEDDRDGHSIS